MTTILIGDPWSGGFSDGFGPLPFPVANLNFRNMATLGITTDQTLYYDYGETEDFYVLVKPDNVLYSVSPVYASKWFGLNPRATQVYNPFYPQGRYPLSSVI